VNFPSAMVENGLFGNLRGGESGEARGQASIGAMVGIALDHRRGWLRSAGPPRVSSSLALESS